MKENSDRIKNLVHTVFYVATIVLFFCFFNLTASMTINIFEQKNRNCNYEIFRNEKKSCYFYLYMKGYSFNFIK